MAERHCREPNFRIGRGAENQALARTGPGALVPESGPDEVLFGVGNGRLGAGRAILLS